MPKGEIVRITETFRIGEDGVTVKLMSVLWRLGKHGPFSFEIPVDQFAANRVKAELERRASEIAATLPPETP